VNQVPFVGAIAAGEWNPTHWDWNPDHYCKCQHKAIVAVHYVKYCYHYCWNYLYHYNYDCGCYYYPFSSTPYYWDGGYGLYYYWGDDCGCYYYDDGSYYYSYWDYGCGCNYYWYSVQEEYYYWDDYCGCHKWNDKDPGKHKPAGIPEWCKGAQFFVYEPQCDPTVLRNGDGKPDPDKPDQDNPVPEPKLESDQNPIAQTSTK
jgi:hypothetical protein